MPDFFRTLALSVLTDEMELMTDCDNDPFVQHESFRRCIHNVVESCKIVEDAMCGRVVDEGEESSEDEGSDGEEQVNVLQQDKKRERDGSGGGGSGDIF